MKKLISLLAVMALLLLPQWSCTTKKKDPLHRPIAHFKEKKEREDHNPDKYAIWTPEQAAHHQKILKKLTATSKSFAKNKSGSTVTYANGSLQGKWTVRGPKNMPGAFKFAEILDGTDIVYAVTHNHYASEYNSKSYIYKGTVYNPKKGKGGDDFELLTANWPNRYQNLFAFKIKENTRLVAHIENGPLYYSDDEGNSWKTSKGLPASNTSSAINRQDNHTIYVTNNRSVYVSNDFGVSFSLIQNFSDSKKSFLYTPRYKNQPNADRVYLARAGSFYTLNSSKTEFIKNGTYSSSNQNNDFFSIGGDSRKLYINEGDKRRFWVSSDGGKKWVEKFPKANNYDIIIEMSAGMFFATNPENENIVIGGYMCPVVSTNGLESTLSNITGWGNYQNGVNLSAQDYYNRIRFNYHPDFQSSYFFYNSSGDLFSLRCSDGGIFISYKDWIDYPSSGTPFNNSGYANAHFINITTLNTPTSLIYRESLFTGAKDPNHIHFGTQDQGSQSIIPKTTTEKSLDFYQNIGGDGPSIDSYDGNNVWKWQREGNKVWAPVKAYTDDGKFLSIGQINGKINPNHNFIFKGSATNIGWVQTYIDQNQPGQRMWMLAKQLNRATLNGDKLVGHTVTKGTNQVAALAQSNKNPEELFMLQDGNVYISKNRGDTFGAAIATPFKKTTESYDRADIGSGVVIPNKNNWILFCGPSTNNVGAILSKNGGDTWEDVTGDFPYGEDAQTGGMVVTPDGKYVFAGTDIGPYVFVVEQEKWYSIAEGIGFFNAMDVDYIASTNTIRFGSWGSGVIDFEIKELTNPQTAYKEHSIPGIIQVEDYDNGGQNVAYNDTDTSNNGNQGRLNEGVDVENTTDIGKGYNIGYINDGEWLEYTVSNIEKGNYDITFRVASPVNTPKSIDVKLGLSNLGTLTVPNTGGYQSWKDVTIKNVNITDPNDNQVLRLNLNGGAFNLNWVQFKKNTAYKEHSIPGIVQVEDYNNGGQGIAYNDTDTSNNGNQGRLNEGVDIENTTDEGKGTNVGWINDGEWLTYTIANIEAGNYDITFRVASPANTPKSIDVKLGLSNLGTLTVPNTGGYQSWKDVTIKNVNITDPNDNQVLRLNLNGGAFNLNWVKFEKATIKDSNRLNIAQPLSNLKLYPNPANDRLAILYKINQDSSITVKVINAIGKTIGNPIHIGYNNFGDLQLDISHLPEGTYFLKVTEKKSSIVKKFIVVR